MIVEEVKVETGKTLQTVKDLRKELKTLKDQLLNTQQGTEEYNQTVVKAANIQHQLKEQMAEINASAMDFGQRLGNVSKTLSGVSGAISAATGALSLFGAGNEEAQQRITATMTSLMGLTQGLSKMDDGIKAFKRLSLAVDTSTGSMNKFKVALVSTGLGALVVVLGSIIAYWDDFTEALGFSTEEMQHFGDIASGVLNSVQSMVRGLATAMGNLFSGNFSGAWESLQNGFDVIKNYNEGVERAVREREESLTKTESEAEEDRFKNLEDANRKRIEEIERQNKLELELQEAKYRGETEWKYTEEGHRHMLNVFESRLKLYKKDSEEYKRVLIEKMEYDKAYQRVQEGLLSKQQEIVEKSLKLQKDLLDAMDPDKYSKDAYERTKQYYDALTNLYEADETNQEKYVNAIIGWMKYQDEFDENNAERQKKRKELFDEMYDDMFLSDFGVEFKKLDERREMLVTAAEGDAMALLDIDNWYAGERDKINKRIMESEDDLHKRNVRHIQEYFNSVGNLLTGISGLYDENSKAQKGIAIAGIATNAAAGIGNALAMRYTTHSGIWDWALGISQAATIGVNAAKQIKQIQKQGKNSGSGMSSATITTNATPSVNLGSVASSASDLTRTLDGSILSRSIHDQRVYVLQSDIDETHNKMVQVRQNATY